ncbi:MAG: hypothetical protein Q4G34_09065, partial [Micrococcus sp.]|nr:hypothetical protein [Micrococcus sp.]
MIATHVERAREAVEAANAAVTAPCWQDVAADDSRFSSTDLRELLVKAETLGRTVAALQTTLAGHLAQAFEHEADRHEVLGIPPGKGLHRDASDCLRDTVRIDRRTAQRRLRRAAATRPRRDFVTAPVTGPELPHVAVALSDGVADETACDTVIETLTRARTDLALAAVPHDDAETLLAAAEDLLTSHLPTMDPDGMRRLCARWRQHVDATILPDGGTPTDAELQAAQGLFHRGRRRGLHRWDLHLTDAQHEVLQTIASAATNPRASASELADPSHAGAPGVTGTDPATDTGTGSGTDTGIGTGAAAGAGPVPDPRTRAQRQGDTLLSALQAALALADPGLLPVAAGHRPQVLVTIDHETLLRQIRSRTG